MPRMPITRKPEPGMASTVILGPCPGCYSWTIEYDLAIVHRDGINLPETVEALLQEHLLECSGMQEIVNAP